MRWWIRHVVQIVDIISLLIITFVPLCSTFAWPPKILWFRSNSNFWSPALGDVPLWFISQGSVFSFCWASADPSFRWGKKRGYNYPADNEVISWTSRVTLQLKQGFPHTHPFSEHHAQHMWPGDAWLRGNRKRLSVIWILCSHMLSFSKWPHKWMTISSAVVCFFFKHNAPHSAEFNGFWPLSSTGCCAKCWRLQKSTNHHQCSANMQFPNNRWRRVGWEANEL